MTEANGNGTRYRLDNLDQALVNIFQRLHCLETEGCVVGKTKMEAMNEKIESVKRSFGKMEEKQEQILQKQENLNSKIMYAAGALGMFVFLLGIVLKFF